jgi:hypothetical protein
VTGKKEDIMTTASLNRIPERVVIARLDTARWLWLVTGCAVAAHLAGWHVGILVAAALTAARGLYQALRIRTDGTMPLQVRALALAVMILGSRAGWHALLFMQIGGIAVRVIFDYCLAGRLLSLLPWNRERPLTAAFVRAVFLTPPGSIHLQGRC